MKKPHLPWYEILSAAGDKPAPLATKTTRSASSTHATRPALLQPSSAADELDTPAIPADPLAADQTAASEHTSRLDPQHSPLDRPPLPDAAPSTAQGRPQFQWLVRPGSFTLPPLDFLLVALAFALALALAFVVGRYHPLPVPPQPLPSAQSLDEIRSTRPVRFETLQTFPAPQRRKRA